MNAGQQVAGASNALSAEIQALTITASCLQILTYIAHLNATGRHVSFGAALATSILNLSPQHSHQDSVHILQRVHYCKLSLVLLFVLLQGASQRPAQGAPPCGRLSMGSTLSVPFSATWVLNTCEI